MPAAQAGKARAVDSAENPAPTSAAHLQTLTSLSALHGLTNSEAAKSIPVAFQATVAYYAHGSMDLFVEDQGMAIYVEAPKNLTLVPGDRVFVRGKTRASFRPDILAENVTFLGHGKVPAPVPATYRQLIRADYDCMRVAVHALVRSANLVSYGKVVNIYLELQMDGGSIDTTVNSTDGSVLKQLLGAEVEVAGSAAGKFDSKMQLTGIVLEVPDISDVKILKPAPSSPAALPFTPMDDIIAHSFVQDQSERVRVQGTITYYLPGAAVVLQSGLKSLWIETKNEQTLNIGDRATASGFPAVRNGLLTLTSAQVEDSYQRSPMTPQNVGWDDLSSGTFAFALISIEGQVVKEGREDSQDVYVLTTGGHLFSVLYRHPDQDLGFELPPMKQIPVGATVRVTGISSVSYGSNPFEGPVGFDVLLRTFDDIQIVAKPSWLTVHNLTRLVELLLLVILAIGVRVVWTERQARHRNATLAYLERRRGRILEDINNRRPLAEILEQINELVSARLGGRPSWIQVTDGARLGNYLSRGSLEGWRVVEHPIPAHSGPALGAIFAAFDPRSKPRATEDEALAQAAGLAALAIETSRLYADLVRRSEFDILTNVQNRFAMERTLEAMILHARQSASIFAVIFIDLNEFKQVNDLHGHMVGDMYLQEVAQRMKRQLRPGDTLGRVGGDEFAILVPEVRNRAQVEEIAIRLEACFAEPFVGDGFVLNGSASIGVSLYPEDATTVDSLLDAADSAMYLAKFAKKSHRPGQSKIKH